MQKYEDIAKLFEIYWRQCSERIPMQEVLMFRLYLLIEIEYSCVDLRNGRIYDEYVVVKCIHRDECCVKSYEDCETTIVCNYEKC